VGWWRVSLDLGIEEERKTPKAEINRGWPTEGMKAECMKNSQDMFFRVLMASIPATAILSVCLSLHGQEMPSSSRPAPELDASARHSGLTIDWTHRHLIFSDPGAADDARQSGEYERWWKITNDPRYAMQQLRRSGAAPGDSIGVQAAPIDEGFQLSPDRLDPDPFDPDLTGEENRGEPETLANDDDFPGGVLPRGLTPALIPPRPQQPAVGTTFPHVALRAHRKMPSFLQKDWSETLGSPGTVGMGNFPATFTTTAASCTADFAVYNSSLEGSSSQAGIVAFNHLYSGCTTPDVYWAFDTGGTVQTSVELSLNGTQVAFVQTDNISGDADFVVLKWAASSGTLTEPTMLTSNSSYPNCTAPCMISIPFSGSPTDTYSSPFIDYASGSAYAGDDSGKMHKFTNVFSAVTPVEASSPWPVTLNTSTDAALGSPVYDGVSDKIFVGDYLANDSSNCEPGVMSAEGQCGYLYSVSAGSGAVVRSAQLDYNLGIYDGPIVDSSAGMVYAFIGADNSTSCSSGPCAAVFQFPVGFTSGAAGTEATVGAGYQSLLSGSFDNQYFTSGSSPSGHLYVVGGTGPQNNTLYAISITGNTMTAGSATAGPQVATNYTNSFYAPGLQVTEFCNNGNSACTATQGTDYLFLSVLAYGSQFTSNPCLSQSASVGCIMGFTAPTSGVISSTATPNGTLQEAGGTSGIVVDNGASGAANIYFSTLLNQTCTTSGGTGGCAVSASQAALQ
jgi:hypothetical protein